MTHTITARNVNGAFTTAWHYLSAAGVQETSRAGPVMVAPGPVVTTYQRPQERVLFNPRRDANHVFHLMEALWMLSGGNEITWLKRFNKRIATYAEDDGHIHGAYGARWRYWFKHGTFDQLREVINLLRRDRTTRQAVLQMWSPEDDLVGNWRDRPCNTTIYFDLRGGVLNMTVCCRSNDILWGCYGANVVHMSVLQELVACAVGAPLGVYRQVSNNWHAYTQNEQVRHFLTTPPTYDNDMYAAGLVQPMPLLQPDEHYEDFLEDCYTLTEGMYPTKIKFMRDVAMPLATAYTGRAVGERISFNYIAACDWKEAFMQWCNRRDGKHERE